jgi:5-hydroxyisourate hydrolase-like protein (transthyretin family)
MGIESGAKITSLAYKGYMSGNKVLTPTVTVWVQNTEDATETTSATLFSTDGMTKVFEGECTFEAKGSSSAMVDMLVINFDTPFEYSGKNLRVIVRSLYTDYQSAYFEADGGVSGQCVVRFADDQNAFLTGSTSTNAASLPVVYMGIEKDAVTYRGVVNDTDGNPLEGVTVTLTSQTQRGATAGSAVYTATTDAEGKFNVNVVQNDKIYDANFAKDGYKDVNVEGLDFANGSIVLSDPVVMELDNVTGVNGVNAGKTVASVKYYNVAGQAADKAFQGVNIVVTTYTDGTTSTIKVIK